MRILLIFDHSINTKKLRKKMMSLNKSVDISLFPLTSQWHCIRSVEKICQDAKETIRIELIESNKLIDREVDILRQRIFEWSFKLGEHNINGRSIKEWFLLPGNKVSTWWFSLLSEKNTDHTDVFFRIAQLEAINKTIASQVFDLCIFSVHSWYFTHALKALCKRYLLNTLRLVQSVRKEMFKKRLKTYLEGRSILSSVLKTLPFICESVIRAMMAKLTMGPLKKRFKDFDDSILIISYFPSVDKESAVRGILKNKYSFPLQEKLTRMGKKTAWVWMYVFLDGYTFIDALKLASKFAKNGTINFFLDEFLSIKLLFRSLYLWLRQIRIFIKLKRLMPENILYENLSVPETAMLIRGLMIESFTGRVGLEGILYFEKYKEVFSYFCKVSHCIYFSEMFAWEKALNAAKQLKSPAIKLIAFQHSFISKNHFRYFYHSGDLNKAERALSLPLPDVLACNGDIPFDLMAGCGYPNIRKVEAIRHLYLISDLNMASSFSKDKILLVVGSTEKSENKALISLVYDTFPKPEGFKMWLKSHPTLPLEKIFKELKIDLSQSGYIIKHEPINELLKLVSAILVGTSSVTLEALASDCEVISPIFADSMFINPLIGFDGLYTKVYNPQDFRISVDRIMQKAEKTKDRRENIDFILRYWCLDESLKRWEELLSNQEVIASV